jgi:hypothetical protein
VFLDPANLVAWQIEAIRAITRLQETNIVASVEVMRSEVRISQARARPSRPLLRAYARLENAGTSPAPNALTPEVPDALPGGIVRIQLNAGSRAMSESAALAIAGCHLDVLVALADPDLLPRRHDLAKFGVWYLEYGGTALASFDGPQVGRAEVLRRSTHLDSDLRIRVAGAACERIACRTRSPVDPMSLYRTRNEHLWKISTFWARALARCRAGGAAAYLESLPQANDSSSGSDSALIGRAPGLGPSLSLPSYALWRHRQRVRRRTHRERWTLIAGDQEGRPDPRGLQLLHPPAGRFWADPHVVERNGTRYVFFEDASTETGKGRISVMHQQGDGEFSPPTAVLERPFHLSYPFVLEWDGDFFMIPESAEDRTVALYRCIRFPDLWQFEHNLMEGMQAYDATLVSHEGRWWMFAGIPAHSCASSWDELCVFHADSPVSRNWRPHPGNPVISDVRRARPAGPFFREGGRLYRPSQDSSGRYGRALNISEVETLNIREYRETIVDRIEPGWNPACVAVHSLSRSGRLTVMDTVLREPR